ncbi:MAG: transcription elongation factor GreB [Deltaproteobacteria bacterium]|nr:MAG: transcription elongation factor GreB [Deltaproteobacteria bacterium]
MGTPNYITKNGLELLRRELDHLQRVLRPQVAEEVRVAAAQGDRSENAAYRFGKAKLRTIDSRLRHLIGRLDHVVEVDPASHTGTKIKFGATVVVEDEQGREKTWKIYGEDEIDIENGVISWKSPLAQALLGRDEGDGVSFRAPQGQRELEILEVRYEAQPKLPDDLIPVKLRLRA